MNPHRLNLRSMTLWALCLTMLAMLTAQTPQPGPSPADAPPASTQSPSAVDTPGSTSGGISGRGASGGASGGATVLAGVPVDANVAVIPVHGPVTPATLDYLKYRLEASVSNGANLIVIELDTPGGDLLAALKISQLLRSSNVPTLAWVNRMAYSAGILIASSCDAIVMAPTAAAGDCAPVQIVNGQLASLSPTERVKLLSPLLAEFQANATTHGYDMAIFQAMCILDARLYEVRHRQTGQVRFINQDDYRVMVRGEDFEQVSAEPTGSADKPVGMAMTLAHPDEQGQWELVRLVHDGKTLLTVDQTQAQAIGLSRASVASLSQLAQTVAARHVSTMPITWSQSTAYWLSRGWVRAILVVVMLLAAFVELQSPGLGLGGIVALLALTALILGPMMAGLALWWHVLLVGGGLVLLLMEIFLVPGVGVLAAGGLMAMFVGLTLMGVPSSSGAFNLPPSATAGRMQAAVLWMLLAILVSGVGFAVLVRYFGQLPFMNRLTLTESLASTSSESGAMPALPVSGDETLGFGRVAVGDTGTTIGALRPAGRARIGQQVVDVVADGQWIESDQPVRVIESRGSRIVVLHDPPASADMASSDSPSA